MSEAVAVTSGKAPSMGTFERYLTLWVALCIVVGIGLGQAVPGLFHALGAATVAQVNLPVAVLVWLMIVPMLLKVDLGALGQARSHWRGIAATIGINWLVKPFSMALLGWLSRAAVAVGSAADARAAVRPARRADHAPACRDRTAGGADLDPGLFQRGPGLLA